MAVMWHGGKKWYGKPEIRPAKTGNAEWGPGLYGTNNYFRAADYAKGGKVTHLIEYQPRLLLSGAAIGMELATKFVRDNAPRSKQVDLLETLGECAERRTIKQDLTVIGDGQPFVAEALLNLWVNLGLASGVRGPALSAFFAEHGIDAYSDRATSMSGQPEVWTVIFNPDAVTGHQIVAAADVPKLLWELPDPRESQGVTISDLLSDAAPEKAKRSSLGMG